MKKVISILLTVIFAFALVLPVSFAEGVTLPTASSPRPAADDGLFAPGSEIEMVQNASVAGSVNATYFKAKERTTHKLQRIQWQIKNVFKENSDNFIIWEAWFLPVDDNFLRVAIQKSGTGLVSEVKEGWTVGRWNHVRAVYESTKKTGDKKGKTHFYINGKHISTVENTDKLDDDMRFSFESNADSATPTGQNYQKVYIQKPYMYFASTNPGAEGAGYTATLTNENLTVFEKKIILPVNVTVDELAVSDNAAIRVYSDSTFATQIADDAVISAGNVVVIDKDGKLDYYDVTGEIKEVIPQPEEWTPTNITPQGTKNGYGGKSSTDTSEYYQHDKGTSAGNIQFEYPHSYYYKYVVVKVNFYFDDASKFSNIQLTTSGTASVEVKSSLVKSGEWNNLILFINTDTEEAKSYLNGKLYSDWKAVSGQFLSDNTDQKKLFRIRVADSTEAGGGYFAIDDFEMYTTVTLPQVEMDKNYKSISGMHTSANNNAFYKSGATVEELLADSKYKAEGATSVIYDASTGIAASGAMPANAKLAIITDDSTIKTYTLNSVDGIYAWDNGVGAKAAVAFADSGVMIAAVYDGIRFLKLSPVEVENGVVKAVLNYSDGEEVKFMLWNSLSGMMPVYSSVVAP